MARAVIIVHPFFARYNPESYAKLYQMTKREFISRRDCYERDLFKFLKSLPKSNVLILFEETKRVKLTMKALLARGININLIVPTYKASGIPLRDSDFEKISRKLKELTISDVQLAGSYYAERSKLSREQLKNLRNKDKHIHCVGHAYEGLSDAGVKVSVVENAVLRLN